MSGVSKKPSFSIARPQGINEATWQFLKNMKEIFDQYEGVSGQNGDRIITRDDLSRIGILLSALETKQGSYNFEPLKKINTDALTPTRLMSTDTSNLFVSVTDLTNWIAGTSNKVTVTDDTDGTVTLTLPDAITLVTPTVTGDLKFSGDGSGVPFAQIYEEDGVGTLALASQDTWYQVTSFTANGESNDAVPDHTNDHITITTAGRYLVQFVVHFEQSVGTSNVFDFHIQKNNGATDFPQTSAHRNGGAGAVGSTGGCAILDLAASDTIELWVERLDGGGTSKTLTFRAISLVVTMVGGT